MMTERQTNYTIGEGYELPSKGKIYEDAVDAHVELRSMTARDEMKRLSPSTTPLKTLADIIEGCMIEKPAVHVYDMCIGDYEYLLHKLRIVSYGPAYKIGVTCPYCGEIVETEANLEDLVEKEFDLETFESFRTVILPRSSKTVTLKFQTPRMLDEIDLKTKELKRKYNTANIDFETYATLLLTIDKVDGAKLNPVNLETFINNLPALDMVKILNSIEKLNSCVGLTNELFVTCQKCNAEIKTFFRIGAEFFRPTTI